MSESSARPTSPAPASPTLATLAIVLLCGVVVRSLLSQYGRMTVLDAFYLNAAARLSHGDTPYHDFTHVAFPFVEWLYAAVFAHAGDLWRAASLTTALPAIGAALFLAAALEPSHGRRAAAFSAIAYFTAAPLVAYHGFEREVWTNLGLAAAAYVVVRAGRDPRAAILLGGLLAFTLLCKLTAAIGAIALLAYFATRSGLREALVAAATMGCCVLVAALLCFSAFGAEFGTQVFVFYFFKGEVGSLGERAQSFLKVVDPCLVLGLLGLVTARSVGGRTVQVFRLLACAWLGYYAVISPSFWDHNAIDFCLPLAAGCGLLLERLIAHRPWGWSERVLCGLGLVGVVFATHRFEPEETRWDGYPHGFGLDVTDIVRGEVEGLQSVSEEDDAVIVANPLVAALARRRAFVSDFELEPVARGVLMEIRLRGLQSAFARRRDGVLLGQPDPQGARTATGNLFAQRVTGNMLLHVMPRWLDAAAHREIAAIVSGPLPPDTEAMLTGAGYLPIADPRLPTFTGWRRDPAR